MLASGTDHVLSTFFPETKNEYDMNDMNDMNKFDTYKGYDNYYSEDIPDVTEEIVEAV